MTCALCKVCVADPRAPGKCIYGGPFLGFRGPLSETEVWLWHLGHYLPGSPALEALRAKER